MSPNPIINMLQPAADPLAGIFNMIRTANDPLQALQRMVMTSPQFQDAVNIINQYGDAKQAFYAEARNRGRDPIEVLRQAQTQAQSMMR